MLRLTLALDDEQLAHIAQSWLSDSTNPESTVTLRLNDRQAERLETRLADRVRDEVLECLHHREASGSTAL